MTRATMVSFIMNIFSDNIDIDDKGQKNFILNSFHMNFEIQLFFKLCPALIRNIHLESISISSKIMSMIKLIVIGTMKFFKISLTPVCFPQL